MSGGSFNYMYAQIEGTYSGSMGDVEMEELLKDFCKLLYELEWYRSCNTSQEQYKKALKEFKDKWFGNAEAREKRL